MYRLIALQCIPQRLLRIGFGYPYLLQEWSKQAWDVAKASPIRVAAVKSATTLTMAALDEWFYRAGFERLTSSEKLYLRAMAELGSGVHRSGDIAGILRRPVQTLGPVRASLIRKEMIWSPTHGDTVFTAPLFDEFMRRVM